MANKIISNSIGEHLIAITHLLREKPKEKAVVTVYRRKPMQTQIETTTNQEPLSALDPLGFWSADLDFAKLAAEITALKPDLLVLSIFNRDSPKAILHNQYLCSLIKRIHRVLMQIKNFPEVKKSPELLIIGTNYKTWSGFSLIPITDKTLTAIKDQSDWNAQAATTDTSSCFDEEYLRISEREQTVNKLLKTCSELGLRLNKYESGSYLTLEESILNLELLYHCGNSSGNSKQNLDLTTELAKSSLEIQEQVLKLRCNQKRFTAKRWNQVLTKVVNTSSREECKLNSQTIAELISAIYDESIRDKVILFAVNDELDSILNLAKERCSDYLSKAFKKYPPEARINRIISFLQYLIKTSGRDDVVLYSVIAYLNWWIGNREKAMRAVAKALATDSEYSLAQLVAEALCVNLPPPFVSSCSE